MTILFTPNTRPDGRGREPFDVMAMKRHIPIDPNLDGKFELIPNTQVFFTNKETVGTLFENEGAGFAEICLTRDKGREVDIGPMRLQCGDNSFSFGVIHYKPGRRKIEG